MIDTEFDHGLTTAEGRKRLAELKAKVEDLGDSARVREVAGPRRDAGARVRFIGEEDVKYQYGMLSKFSMLVFIKPLLKPNQVLHTKIYRKEHGQYNVYCCQTVLVL